MTAKKHLTINDYTFVERPEFYEFQSEKHYHLFINSLTKVQKFQVWNNGDITNELQQVCGNVDPVLMTITLYASNDLK